LTPSIWIVSLWGRERRGKGGEEGREESEMEGRGGRRNGTDENEKRE
jgi:hypothetical protein